MDQFEQTVDFESTYTPSDTSEKTVDRKGLMLFGGTVSHCTIPWERHAELMLKQKSDKKPGLFKAVSNPETMAEYIGAEQSLVKNRTQKVEEPPKRVETVEEMHDLAHTNNLI